MLIVHHLQRSQSERIVWLCEELGLEYELKTYQRDPVTMLAPPELALISPTMSAPLIQDGNITLAESGAITEYLLTKYGHGRLALPPTSPNYAQYLYFLHFANGYFQPALMRWRALTALNPPPPADYVGMKLAQRGVDLGLQLLNDRAQATGGWLAGKDEFTAADVMVVCSLTTLRIFWPIELSGYEGIVAYLQRVGQRPSYRRAMEKADPGFEPLLGGEKPKGYWQ